MALFPIGKFGGAAKKLPHGFASADELVGFSSSLREGLSHAGYDDVTPILQGSAITGKSFKTGAAFDLGRVSDFDVALASPMLLERASVLGIGLRSGGTRTGPLRASNLQRLGLSRLSSSLSESAGRPVNFMISGSLDTAISRAPSMVLR
jgi:filamentous hemagglutinin